MHALTEPETTPDLPRRSASGDSAQMLSRALEIAERASAIVLDYYGRENVAVVDKSDGSPVTEADNASNDFIMDALRSEWDIPIISEEGKSIAYADRKAWDRFWLVDPLDGTSDFITRTDDFCVAIALVEGGRPTLGVIAAPALGITWYAERGGGAFRRDNDGEKRLLAQPSGEVVGLDSRSHPNPKVTAFLEGHGVTKIIKRGAAVKYALVGEGAGDVYCAMGGPKEWDVAPGEILLAEAGGMVRDAEGRMLEYNKEDLRVASIVACSNRFASEQMGWSLP